MATAAVVVPLTGTIISCIEADANIDRAPQGAFLMDVPKGTSVNMKDTWDTTLGFIPQTIKADPTQPLPPV